MNHTNSSPLIPVPRSVAIAVVTLLGIAILAGTVGNASVCLVIRTRRDFRKVPHFLLASLSLTGLLSSLLKMPATLANAVVNYFQITQLSIDVVCNVGFSCAMGFTVLNALTLSLMAIDRQDCVVRPFTRRFTPNNVKKVIIATWVVAIVVISVLSLLLRETDSACLQYDPYGALSNTSKGDIVLTYTMAIGTAFNVGTVFLIIISFIRIIKRLPSYNLPQSNAANLRHERELTYLALKLCTVFIVSWLPVIICNVVARIGGHQGTAISSVKLVVVTLSNLNYVANPVLHFKMLQSRPRHIAPRPNMEMALNIGTNNTNPN